ncbi:twin-arginine translocation signal domain-containing protein [Arcanobacterium hippocoleae]
MTYNIQPWQKGTLSENIKRAGVSRRDFLKFCTALAAIYSVGTPNYARASTAKAGEILAEKLGNVKTECGLAPTARMYRMHGINTAFRRNHRRRSRAEPAFSQLQRTRNGSVW